jgi:hypothetical protein
MRVVLVQNMDFLILSYQRMHIESGQNIYISQKIFFVKLTVATSTVIFLYYTKSDQLGFCILYVFKKHDQISIDYMILRNYLYVQVC